MVLALLAIAAAPAWVPARWESNDPKSLELVADTPVNCLLLERPLWSQAFARDAAQRGIATLGVIHPGSDAIDGARTAKGFGLSGVVLEGKYEEDAAARVREVLTDSHIPLIELTTRSRMRFDSAAPVVGTYQGVWPGVQIQDEVHGSAKSGPSGAPWINTNTGFLRFAHAAAKAPVWIANAPPANTAVSLIQYLHAIGDAGMNGARWVIALDPGFTHRLLARDAGALRDWRQIATHLRYYEDHKDWYTLREHSELALVEDADTGALLSGGVLDMIAVKHTPVRPIPYNNVVPGAMKDARMAVDIDPSALSPEQRDVLKAFTRGGGTLLTGPPGWKFETLRKDEITLGKTDLDRLDEIWKDLNSSDRTHESGRSSVQRIQHAVQSARDRRRQTLGSAARQLHRLPGRKHHRARAGEIYARTPVSAGCTSARSGNLRGRRRHRHRYRQDWRAGDISHRLSGYNSAPRRTAALRFPR